MQVKKVFKINDCLNVKLELNDYLNAKQEKYEIVIYVNEEPFYHCKALLLNIPDEDKEKIVEIEYIDEVADMLNWDTDNGIQKGVKYNISFEDEFFGHCSNLQAWSEHNYDINLLHSHLAFPLLKKLTEAGDKLAKKVFREEITKRFTSGDSKVIEYLISENHLSCLKGTELLEILFEILDVNLNDLTIKIVENILINLNNDDSQLRNLTPENNVIGNFLNKFKVLLHIFIEIFAFSNMNTSYLKNLINYIEIFTKIIPIKQIDLLDRIRKHCSDKYFIFDKFKKISKKSGVKKIDLFHKVLKEYQDLYQYLVRSYYSLEMDSYVRNLICFLDIICELVDELEEMALELIYNTYGGYTEVYNPEAFEEHILNQYEYYLTDSCFQYLSKVKIEDNKLKLLDYPHKEYTGFVLYGKKVLEVNGFENKKY